MPKIVYVKADATGADNGTSWINAYTNFQTGIYSAKSGDSVWVAYGTYRPESGKSFLITITLGIYGGFAGDETRLSQRHLQSNYISTLEGNGNSVIGVTNTKQGTVLDGFTVKDGISGQATWGGGISSNMAIITISNCIFVNNSCFGRGGGAIYNSIESVLTIIDCIFSGNSVGDNGYGGVIYNEEANSTIANCLFINNITGDNGYGGAIYNDASNPNIINCTFVNNSASTGGAICNNYSTPSIVNCIVYDNSPNGITNRFQTNPESVNYSLLQDSGITGIGNLPPGTDPLFQDPENGNYQLTLCSPCINAGNNGYIPSGITTDLAGNPRIIDRIVDMGAYEYQLPNVPSVRICAGQTATLSITDPIVGFTYNWYDVPTGGTTIYTGVSYTTPSLTASQNYYVDATNDNGCKNTMRADVEVIVNQPPNVPSVGSSVTICSGQTATLSVNDPISGLTYNWYNVPTGGTVIYTGISYTTDQLTANQNYYVDATNDNGCTSVNRAEVDVIVDEMPDAPSVESPVTICSGQTAILSIINPISEFTYNWYDVSTGGTTIHTGVSYTTPSLTVSQNYYVDATNNNGCTSTNRKEIDVVVNPFVQGSIITTQPTNSTINIGGQASFTVEMDPGLTGSYQWQYSTDPLRAARPCTWINIHGATSNTLMISDVQSDDSGKLYHVLVVTNCKNEISHAAMLTVI